MTRKFDQLQCVCFIRATEGVTQAFVSNYYLAYQIVYFSYNGSYI